MKISVCISYYNQPEAIDTILDCLASQTRGADQIIVVDDGSDIPFQRSDVQIIRLERHPERYPRFCGVINRGVEAATGSQLVILSSHWILRPDFLATAESLMEEYIQRENDSPEIPVICIPSQNAGLMVETSEYISEYYYADNHTGYVLHMAAFLPYDERFDSFGGVHGVPEWAYRMMRHGRRFYYDRRLDSIHEAYAYVPNTRYAVRYADSEAFYHRLVGKYPNYPPHDEIARRALSNPVEWIERSHQ